MLDKLMVIMLIITTAKVIVEAQRVILRPLSANEVYDVLKKARRDDAIPEGRIITQGISMLSGFTTGLASGIGGVIVYDLIYNTNETLEWLDSITSWYTPNITVNTAANTPGLTQEICFQSRSLNADAPYYGEGRQATTSGSTPTMGGSTPTTPTSGTATSSGSSTYTDSAIDYPSYSPGTTGSGTATADSEETCIAIRRPRGRSGKRRAILQRRSK